LCQYMKIEEWNLKLFWEGGGWKREKDGKGKSN
jgi:hypothetical protein